MKLTAEWTQLGEELRALNAHRRPELTADDLLDRVAPVVPLRAGRPRRSRHVVARAAACVAAAGLAVGGLAWRAAHRPGQAPPVATTPSTAATTPPTADSTGPLARWTFDAVTANSAPEASGRGIPLVWSTDVAGVPGLGDGALQFSGVWPSAAATAGPVLDTSGSFSVSTFVRIDTARDCLYQSIVAQDGRVVSGFELGLEATCPTAAPAFRFLMLGEDRDAATQYVARSTTLAQNGRWYHVVAVRDARAKTMKLFVDGRLESAVTNPTSWRSTGPLTVGRSRFSSEARDFLQGTVDTTMVFDRALTDDEVARLG